MAQHDYQIADQPGIAFLADLNAALLAVVSQNSGETAPESTYPGMPWLDTSGATPVLRRRNQADDGWEAAVEIDDVPGLAAALDALAAGLSGKQATLVSGTNIKTINGQSLLGSGGITISGDIVVSQQVFTTSGTYAKPAALLYAQVEVRGGGGGGGGTSTDSAGGGGGEGELRFAVFAAADMGASETVTVGAGGAAVSGNTTGGNGGTSSFGAHLSAVGGLGGAGTASSAAGVGGAGGTGGSGGTGIAGASGSGGLRGSAGALSGSGGGAGGAGGRFNGSGAVTSSSGVDGTGGGGAGACFNSASISGAGGSGLVIVTEYRRAA